MITSANTNSTPPAPAYRAKQLADGLGVSDRAVRKRLENVPPSREELVRGKVTAAWMLDALPADLLAELEASRVARHFRTIGDLLSAPPLRWQLPVKWADVDERYRLEAGKLGAACADVLPRQHELPRKELLALAHAAHRRAFGFDVSDDRLQYVMDRATERDNGFSEWLRPELYLDEKAFQKQDVPVVPLKLSNRHAVLDEEIKALEDKARPTLEDRQHLFHKVFEHYEAMLATAPREERGLKASLIDYLFHQLPGLSKSPAALREVLRMKLAQWREAGRTPAALQDDRRGKSGNHRAKDFSTDLREIAKMAVELGGTKGGAHGLLRERGELSEDYCDARPHDPRSDKGHLTKSDRRKITPLVEAALVEAHGPKQSRMESPYVTRMWDEVEALDWFVADDVTWNHYFKFRGRDGRWDVTRGECLVMTDALTDYPLDFLLIAGKYNGAHIRQLALKVHDRFGLPRKGYQFERGVWKSRFVVGEREQGWDAFHWRNTENGLNDPRIGVSVHHATTARAKTIEGWFNHVQRRMQLIPGYVGRDERHDSFEAMQQLKDRARRGDQAALAQFHTQDQIRAEYRAVMEEFMHKPSNGDRMPGRTPAEVVAESLNRNGLRQLNELDRVIMATHQKIARLHPRYGIQLRLPGYKRLFCYANAETGKLVEAGETQVRCFVNFERAELLICENLKGTHRFSVRGQIAPAVGASAELKASLAKDRRDHLAPARALFGEIQHDRRANIIRDDQSDEATEEIGRLHNESVAQHEATISAEDLEIRALRKLAAETGQTLPADLGNARQRSGLRRELEGLRQQGNSK